MHDEILALVLRWATVFGRAYHVCMWPAIHINSASYPQRDRKWALAKVHWCSTAGE